MISTAPTTIPGWTTFDTALLVIVNGGLIAWFLLRRLRRTEKRLLEATDRLNELLERVQSEWRFQHRQATYVGTLRGYWRVLEQGAEDGDGLPVEMRRFIYRAGDEMFDAFEHETQTHHDVATIEPVLWTSEEHVQ